MTRVPDTSRGLFLQIMRLDYNNDDEMVRSMVIYRRNVLNSEYPTGTEFQMRSSCDLQVVKISRKVKMDRNQQQPIRIL